MKQAFPIAIISAVCLLLLSCSKRIFEAEQEHKMHDEYFILRKNGHYSIKMLLMGMIGMPDSQHGRYLISSDTVYFVKKKGQKTFHTYAYGIIDSLEGKFSYYPDNNNTAPNVFRFVPKPPISAADK